MTAVELYRHEKARRFANLEPLFAEIRARLAIDAVPPTTLASRNKARSNHPGRDQRQANAAYYQANKVRLAARRRDRVALMRVVPHLPSSHD